MQSIKNARNKSKDPRQEQIREAKDHWNKEVSTLIENLIHFKKMMNGYPSKFYQQRSKIINPLPIEPSKILSIISSDFSRIVENANSISSYQTNYSKAKQTKQASSKISRFFSYLKGPFFGSSPQAQKRRDRIALLKYSSDIYSSFKKLNSEVLNRDLQSIHKAKVIFNKLTSDILTFGTFFKSLDLKEEDLKLEAPKIEESNPETKEEVVVEKNGLDNLPDDEVENLFSTYKNDHALLFTILRVFSLFLNKKGYQPKISEAELKKYNRELGNRFSRAVGSNANVKAKKMAIEIYMSIIDRLKYELDSHLGQFPQTSNAAGLYEWLIEDIDFKSVLEEVNKSPNSDEEKEPSQNQKDFLENIDKVLSILSKHFTEKTVYSETEFNSAKDKNNYVNSKNFEENYKNLLDTLKQFVNLFTLIPQTKDKLNLQAKAKLQNFNPTSIKEVLEFLEQGLKKPEVLENVEPDSEKKPLEQKDQIEFIKQDMSPITLFNLYRRGRFTEFMKNVPIDKKLIFSNIYSNPPKDTSAIKEELNILYSLDPDKIKKEYKEKVSAFIHDLNLFGLDVSNAKTLRELEKISSKDEYKKHLKVNKNAQISNAINWGKKKLHQISFWNSTSPLRTKVSDYCDQGKKHTNSLMNILEADIDPKQIKLLLKELVVLHSKIRELLSTLVNLTMNISYQGDIDNLLSDRFTYDSNLDDKETEDLVKSLNRQRRTRLVRELGGL